MLLSLKGIICLYCRHGMIAKVCYNLKIQGAKQPVYIPYVYVYGICGVYTHACTHNPADSERGRHIHIYALETQTDSGKTHERRNRDHLRLGRHREVSGWEFRLPFKPPPPNPGTNRGLGYGCCFTICMHCAFSSFNSNMNNSFHFQKP